MLILKKKRIKIEPLNQISLLSSLTKNHKSYSRVFVEKRSSGLQRRRRRSRTKSSILFEISKNTNMSLPPFIVSTFTKSVWTKLTLVCWENDPNFYLFDLQIILETVDLLGPEIKEIL